MLRLLFSLALAIVIFGCVNSGEAAFIQRLADVEQRIYEVEDFYGRQVSSNKLIREIRIEIQEAERLKSEGDFESAVRILDQAVIKLDGFRGGKVSDLYVISGAVSYESTEATGFQSLAHDVDPESIAKLRTGADSLLVFQKTPELTLHLGPQTQVHLPSPSEFVLEKGSARIDHQSSGFLSVKNQNIKLRLSAASTLEITELLAEGGLSYVSLLQGSATWDGKGGMGSLNPMEGLYLENGAWKNTRLPNAPEPLEPLPNAELYIGDLPKKAIAFSWTPAQEGLKYRLQVATDDTFRFVVADRNAEDRSLERVNLPPGSFFWRVCTLDPSGIPGPYTDPMGFTIGKGEGTAQTTPQTSGPPLNDLQVQVMGDMAIVTGKTKNRIKITINDVSAAVLDGSFRGAVTFTTSGEHELLIRAIDPSTRQERVEKRTVKIRVR